MIQITAYSIDALYGQMVKDRSDDSGKEKEEIPGRLNGTTNASV